MIKLCSPNLAIDDEIKRKVIDVLESGRYVMGKESQGFESEFAAFCGTKEAVSTSSGTSALSVALAAMGVGHGDEVITTTHSFIATANAIVHAGAKPVLVDVEPDTHNIDPAKIGAAITSRTKGIIPVHIYGHPADMDPITEIAEAKGIFVLEDSCQAHGAEYRGRKAGSIGTAAAFSFFPSKVMTVCGEGGMVTTGDSELAEKMRMIRNQGRAKDKKYEHDVIGYNYRMPEILAAIGRIELKRLPGWLESRRDVAAVYSKNLPPNVALPTEKDYAKAAYYVYTIMTDSRDALLSHLKSSGVESGIYYPIPINKQPAYMDYGFPELPIAESIASKILSLPMNPYLKKEEILDVCASVSNFFSKD